MVFVSEIHSWDPGCTFDVASLASMSDAARRADNDYAVEQDFFRWPPVGVSVSGTLSSSVTNCSLSLGAYGALTKSSQEPL